MIARIRKSMDEKEKGFTLIELLVVIVIIGILAAIAIPLFLNQRKKAADASMKSDLRTVATTLESAYTDTQAYYPVASAGSVATLTGSPAPATTVTISPNNAVTGILSTTITPGQAYCLVAVNAKGTQNWVYKSDAGGLQPSTVTACAAW